MNEIEHLADKSDEDVESEDKAGQVMQIGGAEVMNFENNDVGTNPQVMKVGDAEVMSFEDGGAVA